MTGNNPPSSEENTDGGDQPAAKERDVTAAINAFKSEYEAAQRNQSKHDNNVFLWTRRTAKGVFIYTALTVAITGASVYAAWQANISAGEAQKQTVEAQKQTVEAHRQADAAIAQINIAKEAEETQLRAYLYVRPKSVTTTEQNEITFRTHIVSTGSTPATNIITTTVARDFPYPLPDPFDLPLDYVRDEILGATSEITPPESPDLDPVVIALNKEKVTEISSGKRLIFLYGTLQYRDVFSRDWSVLYCFFYDWESITKTGNANPCPWHNERKQEVLQQIAPADIPNIIRNRPKTLHVSSFKRIAVPPR